MTNLKKGQPLVTAERWHATQALVLDFIGDAGCFSDEEILVAGLIGCCSGDQTVANRGDLLLRKVSEVDLEGAAIINSLAALFLGEEDNKTIKKEDRRLAASIAVRNRIMTYLARSIAAANSVALSVKVLPLPLLALLAHPLPLLSLLTHHLLYLNRATSTAPP
jgi:hypothetical protein